MHGVLVVAILHSVSCREVVGAKRLRQREQNTYKIEQNNALQRRWLGRCGCEPKSPHALWVC